MLFSQSPRLPAPASTLTLSRSDQPSQARRLSLIVLVMSARLFRTCVIAAAGSAVALQRGRPFAGRRFFASATMAAPAAASARLRQKLSAARAQTAAPVAASPQRQILLDSATEQDWDAVVAALEPFMKENRVARLREMLDRRRGGLHLVLENVADPFNAAAVMRSAEGLALRRLQSRALASHAEALLRKLEDSGARVKGATDGILVERGGEVELEHLPGRQRVEADGLARARE